MSVALAGALATALAVTCATFAIVPHREVAIRTESHPDLRPLEDAGWRRPLWQWELIRVACIALLTALAAVTGLPLLGGSIAGALGPSIVVRSRARSATRAARLDTTRVLRQTEAALRSGAGLPEALRRATAGADRLARRPFVDALRAFDLGAPLDLALRAAAERVSDERVRIPLETLAMGIASRLPAERAAVLVQAVADRLTFDERLDEEVRARTSGLRAQVMLLAAVVPAIAVYLALTVPSLGAALAGPVGRTILVPAAIVFEVAGIVASRRAVDGVTR